MCPSIGSVIMANGENWIVRGYASWRQFFDQFDNDEMADDEFHFAVILDPIDTIMTNEQIMRDIKINNIIV
jgi:hypothetical protein